VNIDDGFTLDGYPAIKKFEGIRTRRIDLSQWSMNSIYIVEIITPKTSSYFLWKDGGSDRDQFIVCPGTFTLLRKQNILELTNTASSLGFCLQDQKPMIMDFNVFFRTLNRLRPGSFCSQNACCVLIDGWNLLDDIAYSLKVNMDKCCCDSSDIANSAYDMLFHGNGLEPTIPGVLNYKPVFTSFELSNMRKYIRNLWGAIAHQDDFFSKK